MSKQETHLLPEGFTASGINCGVKYANLDLGLIRSDRPAVAVGVFTQNTCQAAPVQHCTKILPSDNIRANITNSGQANAATGKQGIIDNKHMADSLALHLHCKANQIITASTGLIGERISIDKITGAISKLIQLEQHEAAPFAEAILTTDSFQKVISKEIKLSGGITKIVGIAKGAGMIHPNMATMLSYLLTDVHLTQATAKKYLSEVVDESFNMISVDGETSTNDSVFLVANGASGTKLTKKRDEKRFLDALHEVAIGLAKLIVEDGEGASKLIEIKVTGASRESLARQVARSLTVSPLIKTAMYGQSPNWGRIIARIGAEAVPAKLLDNCSIYLQDIPVYNKGIIAEQKELSAAQERMDKKHIQIRVEFHSGTHSATAWGCDLTEQYVIINSKYAT